MFIKCGDHTNPRSIRLAIGPPNQIKQFPEPGTFFSHVRALFAIFAMRRLGMGAKRGILQELLNNHSFRSQGFGRCYEASLSHDGGRMGLYGGSVFAGRTHSEALNPLCR